MNTVLILATLLILQGCYAPPVTQNKENSENKESQETNLEDYMEYHRYLKEVVNALESDPDFRKKLEKAEESDIKSGKIAEELEFVSHHVRTKLDEIKRLELERLKDLVEQKRKLLDTNAIDVEDPTHHHIDHSNPHTFEIEDLKKLIYKTTADLAEADKLRRNEFKEYELQKEFEKQDKLNHTNGDEREKLEKEFKEREAKHKQHERLREPGHRAQLEEVWRQQDQMQQDFDPRTFFNLHDLDGNGLWDQDEVKALFVKELQKMYEEGAPEDDVREKAEEMERMRESVFREIDRDADRFIDFEEFLAQTKTQGFQQDHGWQGLDEQRPYTDEELQEYIRQHQMQQMQQQGYHPQGYQPNPNYQQGYHGQPPQGYPPQAYHPNAIPPGQFHPGQMPPNMPQGLPPNHPNAGYQQKPPQQYQQFQPPPPQQQQYQPPPPQQYQQQQQQPPQQNQPPPPQQYQQQQPPQQQQQQNSPQQGYNQQPAQNQQAINQQQQQGQAQNQQQHPPQAQQQQQPAQVNQQQQQQQNIQQQNNNIPNALPPHVNNV